jgi:hypothetical protein
MRGRGSSTSLISSGVQNFSISPGKPAGSRDVEAPDALVDHPALGDQSGGPRRGAGLVGTPLRRADVQTASDREQSAGRRTLG